MPKKDNIRSLEDVCEMHNFVLKVLDNTYCGIKPTQGGVKCKYRAEEPDHNDLYCCKNPIYKGN